MTKTDRVIMIASENGALKGGKVGGLADVVRDLPKALADLGWRTTVITPSYGFLHTENPSKHHANVSFPFGGKTLDGKFFTVTPRDPHENIQHLVFEHPDVRGTPIYYNDPPEHAYAQDATKFALFCSAVGQFLKTLDEPFILHLHDWHAAFLLLLMELHPDFAHLKKCRKVFTIHNLSLQGTRPILGLYASVERWFPELFVRDRKWIDVWKDARYTEPSFTPMGVGIRFADRVNTVSPTYAEEILQPSDHAKGFYGGEGLENLLQDAKRELRLFGILNGCEYPANRSVSKMSFPELCRLMMSELQQVKEKNSLHDEILRRIASLQSVTPAVILTSVTRVVDQKVRILFERTSNKNIAIDDLMDRLAAANGVYIVQGTGTREYEEKLAGVFRKHERCILLPFYSELIAQSLYANGTLFMMPSSFEPCGISQMLAMRDGQPCIVHAVGGLKDTVIDGVNGFTFDGKTSMEQADGCVQAFGKAIDIALNHREQWTSIAEEAARARFTWKRSAQQYIDSLYL